MDEPKTLRPGLNGSTRRHHAGVVLALAVILTLLGGSAAVRWRLPCSTVCSDSRSGGTGGALVSARPAPALRIGGATTDPLEPGRAAPVDLVLANRSRSAVVARRFAVSIEDVRAPGPTLTDGCTLRDFAVVQSAAALSVRLAPRSTTTLSRSRVPRDRWPRVVMRDRPVAQDDCRGVVVELRFSSAVRQVR